MSREGNDDRQVQVVVNDDGQYSIWPVEMNLPSGWKIDGKTGTKAECLAYIDDVWTELRPLGVRRQMDEAGRQGARGCDQ